MKRIIALFIIIWSTSSFSQPFINNCQVFPKNNIWNTPIDKLPVHPKSNEYISTIGAGLSLRNDFGAGLWNGAPIGIPFVLVDGNQEKVQVTFVYDEESDKGGYPIPPNPPIEGGNESTGDRHIIIIDTSNCILYELYNAYQNDDKTWRAGSGAIFNLNSNELRPLGWTSADAAGLPIFPGLVRYEEVQLGEIKHRIRFTAPKTQRKFIWPARHYASSITNENYPPMGLVVRLKSSFNTDKLGPQAKVIANALKTYGMILADNGSPWFISGVPNEKWDMEDLFTLRQIKGSDFEAVDISSLLIDTNSAEAKQIYNNLDDNISVDNILIFHPSSNYIEIIFKGFILNNYKNSIKIYNPLGDSVLLYEINNSSNIYRIDISNLPTGVYFFNLGNRVEKFFVVR